MRRVLLLPFLLAAGVAGCGETGNDLIPPRTAARMIEQVDKVEAAMAQDPPRCVDARNAAEAGRRRAAGLSSKVDEELQANLVDWFDHLEDEARKECRERQRPEETPTATPSPTEEPEETPEPTPSPTPTATEEPTPTVEPTVEPTEEPTGGAGFDEDEE